MDIAYLKSWTDFRGCFERLIAKASENRLGSKLLFRGHASAEWHLDTTLERSVSGEYPISAYYRKAMLARRYLSNFSGSKWQFDENVVVDRDSLFRILPNFEYLAYLRHHGFPSPFLDWTQSPYVAAFFAFYEAKKEDSDSVAIFVYQEYEDGSKSSGGDAGDIRTLGNWAQVHERHASQQSSYSFCFRETFPNRDLVFSSHNKVFESGRQFEEPRQDILLKIVIPKVERTAALRDLFLMNVTPYSIFRSEDSLVATAASKLFEEID